MPLPEAPFGSQPQKDYEMKMRNHALGIFLGTFGLMLAGSAQALTPEDKCEADKNKIAGKYAFCRQKEEAKAIKKGVAPDFSKCDEKLLDKWGKAEAKAVSQGTTCMDGVSDTDIQSFVMTHVDAVAAALDGGDLPECGDGAVNAFGEECDGADFGGKTCASFGLVGGTLACLPSCELLTFSCYRFGLLATGQTTSFGAGSDGDVMAGMGFSYSEDGDGTITDNNTGLMWEKKDDSGGIHDKDNQYSWCGASCGTTNEMDGTIKTVFIDTLNDVAGGGANCFAGYCDWRVPNLRELQSIIDFGESSPTIAAVFHQSGTCVGCMDVTLPTCSCTSASSPYWSSTSLVHAPAIGWGLSFGSGFSNHLAKTNPFAVRAVRGGL